MGGPHENTASNPSASPKQGQPASSSTTPASNASFQPTEYAELPPDFALPDSQWLNVLSSTCTFPPDVFEDVMYNLVKNPNITSSHLFRADIYYDSHADRLNPSGRLDDGLVKHLKAEYRPVPAQWPGFALERTIVRQMVPRNPKLDRPLVQTCHFFRREHAAIDDGVRTDSLVLYVPHAASADDMPFYHPCVRQLAFLHCFLPRSDSSPSLSNSPPSAEPVSSNAGSGEVSILYLPFAPTTAQPSSPSQSLPAPTHPPSASPPALAPKLTRTALHLLATLHKHGQGTLAGYAKRVHLDRLVPQRAYQDTYARLKATHGAALAHSWAETTDPTKHVFEDLGIAAFLIELWKRIYADFPGGGSSSNDSGSANDDATTDGSNRDSAEGSEDGHAKPRWRGFVDIGCGNGVLVHVLLSEGCGPGWGFDARARKSWAGVAGGAGASGAGSLATRVLVPRVLQAALSASATPSEAATAGEESAHAHDGEGGDAVRWHDGLFAPRGTFIIANHADQLTLWTPLLAYLNASCFVAIPCCSHDFAGARFRAPLALRGNTASGGGRVDAGGPGAEETMEMERAAGAEQAGMTGEDRLPHERASAPKHAAESGMLVRAPLSSKSKPPSAYASLCAYVVALAGELGFVPETETLRIPSTRNECIVGRRWRDGADRGLGAGAERDEEKTARVVQLVEREMRRSIGSIAQEWVERVEGLTKRRGSGH